MVSPTDQMPNVLLWRPSTMSKQHMSLKPMQQQGFTLVELMISLVLGLLVIAAATGIFLSAQRSMNMQTGMSELQQNSIFGLSQIAHDLRHVNLNTTNKQSILLSEKGAGIIFTVDNALRPVANGFLTQHGVTATNMNVQSDRLTIQYKPNSKDLTNCEGETLDDPTLVNIQSYFIQPVANSNPARYELRCSAMYKKNSQLGAGIVLLPDVEAFKVRFGVESYQKPTPTASRDQWVSQGFSYKTRGQLVDTDRIVSVEIGVVARSSSSVGSGNGIDPSKPFVIVGQTVRLSSTEGQDRFLREGFSQVVAIRNGQGL